MIERVFFFLRLEKHNSDKNYFQSGLTDKLQTCFSRIVSPWMPDRRTSKVSMFQSMNRKGIDSALLYSK